MMKKYLIDIVENVGETTPHMNFNLLTCVINAMTKFTPLKGLNTYANSGKSRLSPNSQDSMANQTQNGSKGSIKQPRNLKDTAGLTKGEKAKLGRILAKEKRIREDRQHSRDNLIRKAVQIRKAEEAYLPTPNQDYTYQFFCGAPKRIRKNERTRTRSSGGKSVRVFQKSKWQGRYGSDFD